MRRFWAVRHIMMVACLVLGDILSCVPALAVSFSLPGLPQGCHYTQNSFTPLTATIRIPTDTPQYGVLGNDRTEILAVEVQCDTSPSTPVSAGINAMDSLQWQGPGGDILSTPVSGVGIRLFFEGQTEGGRCSSSDWLSSSRGSLQCTSGTTGPSRMGFRLSAQLVKTGENTPVMQRDTLMVRGGDVQVTVNDSSQSLLSQGAVAPLLATEVSCTIVDGKKSEVNFGSVQRRTSYWPDNRDPLAEEQSTITVSCSPRRDENANNYNVSLTFQGTASPYIHGSAGWWLGTSFSDLMIGAGMPDNGSRFAFLNQPLSLTWDRTTNLFSRTIEWYLYAFDDGKATHDQTGPFTATATYTITVE